MVQAALQPGRADSPYIWSGSSGVAAHVSRRQEACAWSTVAGVSEVGDRGIARIRDGVAGSYNVGTILGGSEYNVVAIPGGSEQACKEVAGTNRYLIGGRWKDHRSESDSVTG